MQAVEKAKEFLSDARVYWKKPMAGKYINYRSIFSYSVGGIGVYAVIFLYTTISVSSTNVVISNATGLDPTQLLMMYYVTFFISIFFTGFRAKLIDNARSKKGKYRPYILTMGIPTAVLCCLAVWMPYELIPSAVSKIAELMGLGQSFDIDFAVTAVNWTVAFLINLGLQFCYGFFYEAYENLILVMSPNTQERSDVVAVKSVVYSFAPTVLNPLIPLLQKWLGASDMYDVRIYRIMFPPTAILGMLLAVLVYAYTEEKIVQAKTHIVQIRFTDALRAVAKNKYFWIISLAGWIGFLESSYNYILTWLYNYAGMCTAPQYALITTIYGNASLWGMIAAPFAIKKFGKKKVLIVTNFFNILFIALLYPAIDIAHSIWLVLGCLYMNALVGSFSHILTPSLNADIRDYQQYITGERIDGMFAAVGLIGSAISLVTSSVLPAIFKSYGISADNGYENMYDILKYEPDTMYSLVYLLILLAVIGASLNVVPYFFYDLSELKQRGMVKILKVRALFEDYGNGVLNDADLIEAVDIIRTAKNLEHAEKIDISKETLRTAKSQGKDAYKAAKKQLKEAREFNEEIEISVMINEELNKFSRNSVKLQLAKAKEIYAAGLQYALTAPDNMLKEAKALPGRTAEEKLIRSNATDLAKKVRTAKKCAKRYFPDGIPQYDGNRIQELFEREDLIDGALNGLYKESYAAKDSADRDKLESLKSDIKTLKTEKKNIQRKLKEETKAQSNFHRAAKPYLEAVKLIEQEKNYDNFEEISSLYGEAKARNEAEIRALAKEEAKLAALRKAEKEKAKKK